MLRSRLASCLAVLALSTPALAEDAEKPAPALEGQVRTGMWFARMDRVFNEIGDRSEYKLIIDDRDVGTGHGLLIDFGFDLSIYGSRLQFDYFTDQVISTAEDRVIGGNRLAQQAYRMLVGRIEPRTKIGSATLVIGARRVDVEGPIAHPGRYGAFDNRDISGQTDVRWKTSYTSVDAALLGRDRSDRGHTEYGPMLRYTHFSLPSAFLILGPVTAASIPTLPFLVTGTQDMVDFMISGGVLRSGDTGFLSVSGEVGVGYLRMNWPGWGGAQGMSFPASGQARAGLVVQGGPIRIKPYVGLRFQTWMPLLGELRDVGGDDITIEPPETTTNWIFIWGPELGLEVEL